MYIDSHNHTKHYSPDAKMSIDELISVCEEKSCEAIAITEHYELDYPYKEDELFQLFDIDKYQADFSSWQQKSPHTKLLMGMEFGYQAHVAQEIDRISSSYPFDTVILSNHLFEGVDFYFDRDVYARYSKDELIQKYVASLVEMADKCNNYNIIGHYDYINRYADWKNPLLEYDCSPKEFDNLFEVIVAKEKALEINSRSVNKLIEKGFSMKESLPDSKLLLRYKSAGGKLISLGSDSHTNDTIGIHFEAIGEYLRSLGFKEYTYYVAGKPIMKSL